MLLMIDILRFYEMITTRPSISSSSSYVCNLTKFGSFLYPISPNNNDDEKESLHDSESSASSNEQSNVLIEDEEDSIPELEDADVQGYYTDSDLYASSSSSDDFDNNLVIVAHFPNPRLEREKDEDWQKQ